MTIGVFQRAIVGAGLFAGLMFGQGAAKPLEFEVASIKPHVPGDTSSSTQLVNGGIDATNVTLRQLILRAYDVQEFQLLGGLAWISEDRWDIRARTPDFVMPQDPNSLTDGQRKTILEQMQERLRNLLADRFQVVARREQKEQPIYVLVVSRNGPKLTETKVQGSGNNVNTSVTDGKGRSTFTAATTGTLAQQLSRRTNRPVVDKTGLTGKYDFTLEWWVDMGSSGGINSAGTSVSSPEGPTIFTALQEQLGLRLESQKGPVDVITIERAEKPSEN